MERRSIHNWDRQIGLVRARIERSDLVEENKKLLFDFDKYLAAEGLGVARRVKLVEEAYLFAVRHFRWNFREATGEQIMSAVAEVEAGSLAPWTKHDIKVAVRKFFKFVIWGHLGLQRSGYPELVAGIKISVKKRDRVNIQAADILTEDEVMRLLAAASDAQQRAVVSVMYELGARVGEVGTLTISDLGPDEFGYIIDLNGKTGRRSVRSVAAAPALTSWLNLHPQLSNPKASLWGKLVEGQWTAFDYRYYQHLLPRLAKHAGIQKRVHPHLLRHSRVTHILASGFLNEAQAKVFFGLVADSDMMATYAHLLAKDANDAVLRIYGFAPVAKPAAVQVRKCHNCSTINEAKSSLCYGCGEVLSKETWQGNQKAALLQQFLARPEIQNAFRAMTGETLSGFLHPREFVRHIGQAKQVPQITLTRDEESEVA